METTAAFSPEEVAPHLHTAQNIVVVLTKGLLQDSGFATLLFAIEWRCKDEPVDIVPVLADSNFEFPTPEFYTDLEIQGGNIKILADGFRRMLGIIALPFTPDRSLSIMKTQVDEIGVFFSQRRVSVGNLREIAPATELSFRPPAPATDPAPRQDLDANSATWAHPDSATCAHPDQNSDPTRPNSTLIEYAATGSRHLSL